MITRKIAKQVFDIAFKDEIAQLHQKHVELMLNKFPNEPTPDEMLEEMREWAKSNDAYYYYDENPYKTTIFFKIGDVTIRTEAIIEAYRQFKEATSGDN